MLELSSKTRIQWKTPQLAPLTASNLDSRLTTIKTLFKTAMSRKMLHWLQIQSILLTECSCSRISIMLFSRHSGHWRSRTMSSLILSRSSITSLLQSNYRRQWSGRTKTLRNNFTQSVKSRTLMITSQRGRTRVMENVIILNQGERSSRSTSHRISTSPQPKRTTPPQWTSTLASTPPLTTTLKRASSAQLRCHPRWHVWPKLESSSSPTR